MSTNEEIAETLDKLADLLVARGELIFKIRAYRKAAASIRELGTPLAEGRSGGDLRRIPGVGEAIAKKVSDMLEMGTGEWLASYVAKLDARK